INGGPNFSYRAFLDRKLPQTSTTTISRLHLIRSAQKNPRSSSWPTLHLYSGGYPHELQHSRPQLPKPRISPNIPESHALTFQIARRLLFLRPSNLCWFSALGDPDLATFHF